MQQLQQLFERLSPEAYPWLWQVFLVVVFTLLAGYISRIVFHRLELQFQRTHNLWDDALFEAGRKPAAYLIWLIGASWVFRIMSRGGDSALLQAVIPARDIMIIVLLAWFVVRIVKQAEQRLVSPDFTAEPMDETTVMAVAKLLRVAVMITATLVVLQTMGYSVSGVLAFGGIGGIAVGFAAKDLLSNFFGGLMVYLDRPFAIGDWIRSPDKQIEGTVEHIGWRQTRIRTFDKRPLYVPNGTFTQISVENPSRMANRRIKETIGIRYDDADQLKAIINEVKAYLQQHDDIDQRQTLIVNFNAFGPSSLDFFIYTFTKTTDWVLFHEIKQAVLLDILDIISRRGAEVAFPTSTIHMAGLDAEPCAER